MTQPPYQVLNPATGELLQSFETMTDDEVDVTLERATTAQAEWAEKTVKERAGVLLRVADAFDARAEELAALVTTEMGKKISSAVGEAQFAASIFRYYGTQGPTLIADQPVKTATGDHAAVERRPIGVVLGVMPWNYPYYQVARFAAPNLLLGNAVVVKHAEACPISSQTIEDVLLAVGLPAGLYTNVYATFDQVAAFIADDRLAGVSLTGSERAGRVVAELAGRALKKVVLELGGSDPYIVLDSTDVAQAARDAWRLRISNMGQACNSNKRIIVSSQIADEFIAALVHEATGLVPGDPRALAASEFAPMVNREAAERIAAVLQDAVDKGAALHVGGRLIEGPGAYLEPAVLTGVTPEMTAFHEEVFGPVAVVHVVDSDDAAVELANATRFGLGGAVFSTDVERARAVAARLDCGMAHVNIASAEAADMPFGGTKASGFGRELGELGVDEFANKRLFYVAG